MNQRLSQKLIGLSAAQNSESRLAKERIAATHIRGGQRLLLKNGEGIRTVIADDQPIFRGGLRKLIESQTDMCVIGESPVGAQAVRLAREKKPDLLLLDLALPKRSGLQVLSCLAGITPPLRTLVLASAVEEGPIVEAFSLGARGIMLKDSLGETLLQSIRSVMTGQYWLDNQITSVVIEALRKFPPPQNGITCEKKYGLTPRELKIVDRVASGSSNKEVGQEFNISERTVKHHLTNVFNKLGISGRVGLAVFALENGLVNKRQTDASWGCWRETDEDGEPAETSVRVGEVA